MKSILKYCIAWIIGVIVAVIAMSLWRNEEVDWEFAVTMIVGGLIGVLIASGIKMYIKKMKDKANE